MPNYPADSIAHKINEHSCGLPDCPNSKIKGATMRRCARCRTEFYCSTECQRADWGRHKTWCKIEVERERIEQARGDLRPGLAEDFDAWRSAMGPMLFIWICVHGLEVFRDPENIRNKFVHLSLKERSVRPTNTLKLFELVSITTYPRSEMQRVMLVDPVSHAQVVEQFRESNKQALAQGKAGVALLDVSIAPAHGDVERGGLFRYMPVVLKIEALEEEVDPEWKELIKDIINNGTSIKRMLADRERAGAV
ncbi:hypothetical protein C8R43DRAFT_1114595 [Mycena crocata]|nr:hypothetical protein C8R43DRAFT_1114595 [Mycena crocata]